MQELIRETKPSASSQALVHRACELLSDGTVARVLGWKKGDLPYNPEPAFFDSAEALSSFTYDAFCGANLSKYMIEASRLEGKTLWTLHSNDSLFTKPVIACTGGFFMGEIVQTLSSS